MEPTGRKLPQQLENQVDNAMISVVEKIHPFFKRAGFTPNGITFLSALFQGTSVYLTYIGSYVLAALFFIIGYFFDDMDGWYARYYKMTSLSGDMFDHYKDITIVALYVLFFVFTKRLTLSVKVSIAVLLVSFQVMTYIYLGCQEVYYNRSDETSTLNVLRNICPQDKHHSFLKQWRCMGTGTSATVFAAVILSLRWLANP
jgi:phosphatidylglycerophosphate synthase